MPNPKLNLTEPVFGPQMVYWSQQGCIVEKVPSM